MKPDDNFKLGLKSSLPQIRRYAQVLTRNKDAAEELVQSTLETAWVRRSQFQAGTLTPWLFDIMKKIQLNESRKDRDRRKSFDVYKKGLLGNPEGFLAAPEGFDRTLLRETGEIIEAMPVAQKEALYLVGVEGYSYEEAAALLKCEIGTVKSRVSRARERLYEVFNEDAKPSQKRALKMEAV